MEGDYLIRHPDRPTGVLHLSLALLVRPLRVCVATACPPAKNSYDSNAARHSSSARIWLAVARVEPALACARTAAGRRTMHRPISLTLKENAHETSSIYCRLSHPDGWSRS